MPHAVFVYSSFCCMVKMIAWLGICHVTHVPIYRLDDSSGMTLPITSQDFPSFSSNSSCFILPVFTKTFVLMLDSILQMLPLNSVGPNSHPSSFPSCVFLPIILLLSLPPSSPYCAFFCCSAFVVHSCMCVSQKVLQVPLLPFLRSPSPPTWTSRSMVFLFLVVSGRELNVPSPSLL